MKRNRLGLGMALVLVGTALGGCELTRHEHQPKAISSIPEEEDPTTVGAVKSKPPEGFFQSTRLPGAWSSEARSIERNLGVQ